LEAFAYILLGLSNPTDLLAGPSNGLSVEEVVSKALQNNPSYLASSHNLAAANAQVKAESSEYLPSLDMSARTSRDQGVFNEDPSNPSANFGIGMKVSIPLFTGFSTELAVGSAELKVKKATANQKIDRLNLIRNVKVAYYQLFFGQLQIEARKKILERRNQQLTLIKIRQEGGHEARWTLTKSAADVTSAEGDLLAASNNLVQYQYQLAVLLGSSEVNSLIASGPFPGERKLTLPAFDGALLDHPDLIPVQIDLEDAKNSIAQERAKRWPSLSAFTDLNRRGNYEEEPKNSWAFGIEAKLPIFSPKLSHTMEASAQSLSAKQLALTSAMNELPQKIVSLYHDYQNTTIRIRSIQGLIAAAKERTLVIFEEYKAGLRQFAEWEESESQLLSAERDLLSEQMNLARLSTEWDRLQGKELTP
jgi:outer membrane protein TolC